MRGWNPKIRSVSRESKYSEAVAASETMSTCRRVVSSLAVGVVRAGSAQQLCECERLEF